MGKKEKKGKKLEKEKTGQEIVDEMVANSDLPPDVIKYGVAGLAEYFDSPRYREGLKKRIAADDDDDDDDEDNEELDIQPYQRVDKKDNEGEAEDEDDDFTTDDYVDDEDDESSENKEIILEAYHTDDDDESEVEELIIDTTKKEEVESMENINKEFEETKDTIDETENERILLLADKKLVDLNDNVVVQIGKEKKGGDSMSSNDKKNDKNVETFETELTKVMTNNKGLVSLYNESFKLTAEQVSKNIKLVGLFDTITSLEKKYNKTPEDTKRIMPEIIKNIKQVPSLFGVKENKDTEYSKEIGAIITANKQTACDWVLAMEALKDGEDAKQLVLNSMDYRGLFAVINTVTSKYSKTVDESLPVIAHHICKKTFSPLSDEEIYDKVLSYLLSGVKDNAFSFSSSSKPSNKPLISPKKETYSPDIMKAVGCVVYKHNTLFRA